LCNTSEEVKNEKFLKGIRKEGPVSIGMSRFKSDEMIARSSAREKKTAKKKRRGNGKGRSALGYDDRNVKMNETQTKEQGSKLRGGKPVTVLKKSWGGGW